MTRNRREKEQEIIIRFGGLFSAKWDGFKLLPVFTTHSEIGKIVLGGATSGEFGNEKEKVCRGDLPCDRCPCRGRRGRPCHQQTPPGVGRLLAQRGQASRDSRFGFLP